MNHLYFIMFMLISNPPENNDITTGQSTGKKNTAVQIDTLDIDNNIHKPHRIYKEAQRRSRQS